MTTAVTVRRDLGGELLKVRGRSPTTTELYRRAASDFLAWCRERGERPAVDTASEYLAAVRRRSVDGRRVGAAYINQRLYGLKAALRQAAARTGASTRELAVLEAALRELRPARTSRPDVKVVTPEERRVLFAALPPRMQLIARALYISGARVSELLAVETGDLTAEGSLTAVRLRGKGDRQRTVRLPAELVARVRETFGSKRGPLFRTTRGGPYERRYVSRELARAAQRVLGRSVTAHVLRHSRFTDLYASTRKVKAIADLAGHASESVTLRYYVRDSLTTSELFGPEAQ